MKTFVVGDLHGQYEIAENVLKLVDDNTRVVFVGDYLDSFTRHSVDCVGTLNIVLEACKSNPNNVIGLMGNHELSYLMGDMRCSGYNAATYAQILPIRTDINKFFSEYYKISENTIVTHAGITGLFDQSSIGNESAELKTIEMVLSEPEFKYAIGYARGGGYPHGGIFWCDWYREFIPFQHVSQIVGHSATRTGIVKNGNSYNIDCLETVIEENQEILLVHEDDSKERVNIHDI